MKMDRKQQIINIIKQRGIVNAADIESAGISRNYLYMLFRDGLIEKTSRGLYMLKNSAAPKHSAFIEIAKKAPKAVICLASALSYYEITSQIPHEVWLALPKGAWKPKISYPPLNITFLSPETYHYGIEEYEISGNRVKIYSIAKTVADCFKFRNKIGLDVAIEALKESLGRRKVTVDEVMAAAKVCRVGNIIRPYLETVL
jgi:predicted transcriptional regulator of viral defense system